MLSKLPKSKLGQTRMCCRSWNINSRYSAADGHGQESARLTYFSTFLSLCVTGATQILHTAKTSKFIR